MVAEPSSEPKETKPANLVGLRTAAAALRDQIIQVYGAPDHSGSPQRSHHTGIWGPGPQRQHSETR